MKRKTQKSSSKSQEQKKGKNRKSKQYITCYKKIIIEKREFSIVIFMDKHGITLSNSESDERNQRKSKRKRLFDPTRSEFLSDIELSLNFTSKLVEFIELSLKFRKLL